MAVITNSNLVANKSTKIKNYLRLLRCRNRAFLPELRINLWRSRTMLLGGGNSAAVLVFALAMLGVTPAYAVTYVSLPHTAAYVPILLTKTAVTLALIVAPHILMISSSLFPEPAATWF